VRPWDCIPERKTCLASSFASVLYFAGQEEAAKKLELCIAQNELKQGLLLNRNFVNAVNALGIKDELGHKMKMFRQKSYDVLKGPSPAAIVLRGTDMVQVMLCPSKTTLSMHLGPMLCQELWKRGLVLFTCQV
jgi:hypothetical protein